MFEPTKISGLRRGMMARDIASGVTGMVTSISQYLNGSVLVEIQPQGQPGATERPKSLWIDEKAVECVDQHMAERFTYADVMLDLSLGDVVTDIVTGATGTITDITLYLNGCIYCCVTPVSDHGDNSPKPVMIDQHRLQKQNAKRLPSTRNESGGAPSHQGERARHV